MPLVKHNLPDDLVNKLNGVASYLDIDRSTLVTRLLQSCFTDQMHFIHVVRELDKLENHNEKK